MKYIFFALFFITSVKVMANETHSPQFKCEQAGGETVYILMGNEFPQIPDLDWSHEIYLASGEQYFNGSFRNNELYTIARTDSRKIIAINKSKPEQLIILDNSNALTTKDGDEVKVYSCIKQGYVD